MQQNHDFKLIWLDFAILAIFGVFRGSGARGGGARRKRAVEAGFSMVVSQFQKRGPPQTGPILGIRCGNANAASRTPPC
jgi:hypothetical protein